MEKEEQVIREVIFDDRQNVAIIVVIGYKGDERFFHRREELVECV